FDDRAPTNGRQATAEDVMNSIVHGSTNRPEFLKRSRYAVIDKMEPTGTDLTLHLSEPNGPLITYLGQQYILAKETFPADLILTPDTIRGTGPFYLKSWQPSVGGNMVRKTDYWRDAKLPYMDGVNWTIIQDQAALV